MIKEKIKPIFFICFANMLMLFTFFSVNTTCNFYVSQDKIPENAKKLRRF